MGLHNHIHVVYQTHVHNHIDASGGTRARYQMDVLDLSHAINRMHVRDDLQDELLASHKDPYLDAGNSACAYMKSCGHIVHGDCMELDGHMLPGEHMAFDERRKSYDYMQLCLATQLSL